MSINIKVAFCIPLVECVWPAVSSVVARRQSREMVGLRTAFRRHRHALANTVNMVNKSCKWTEPQRTLDSTWPKAPEGVSNSVCRWVMLPSGSISLLSGSSRLLRWVAIMTLCEWLSCLGMLWEFGWRMKTSKRHQWKRSYGRIRQTEIQWEIGSFVRQGGNPT